MSEWNGQNEHPKPFSAETLQELASPYTDEFIAAGKPNVERATNAIWPERAKQAAPPPTDPYPPMPADFSPDGITVAATYQGAELGFRFTKEELEDGLLPDLFKKRLKALREALWAGAHWSNDHLRVADLRNA